MSQTTNKMDQAIQRYQEGSGSAWKCASDAQVSLWEFLEELKNRGIGFKTDEDELKGQLIDSE